MPTASPFTRDDFEAFQDCEARLFWSSGMRPNDRYCHALNFTLFVGGPDVIGAMKVGALTIWAGTIPSERLLSIFQTWKPTITWTTPSYAWYLGETAKESGINVADLAIKKIFVAGEYVCVITEEKHMTVLTVEVEKQDNFDRDEAELVADVQNECRKIIGIKPRVRVLAAKSIARATHKAKRVRDERKKQ